MKAIQPEPKSNERSEREVETYDKPTLVDRTSTSHKEQLTPPVTYYRYILI